MRGTVMTCYAQVEFYLANLTIRCSYLECYNGVAPKFPRKLTDRIRAVQRLVAADGPLALYRAEVDSAIGHIRSFTDLRDLMGHATAHMDVSPTEHVIHFEMYDIVSKGRLQLVAKRMTLEQLSHNVDRLVLYTNHMVNLFRRMQGALPTRRSTDLRLIPDP